MSRQSRPKALVRWWLLGPAVLAALALAYALAGFVLAPWIAERELPRFIEEQLHHRARVDKISFNPFTLRLQASGFALETKEGQPVLGFAEAIVDLEWRSLLQRAWLLDEVRLIDPAVHVEIAKDGRLNLARLVPATRGTAAAPPARFTVGHVSVVNGSIDFEDHRQAYRNRAERLSIELSSVSTLGPEMGAYAIKGQTPGGAKLQWKGEVSLAPLAATGTLAVENAALAELMPYIDDVTAVRVVAGRADLELPYHLALAEGKPQFSLKGAKLQVRELALASAGEKALLTKFGAIALGGIDFNWGKQHFLVKSLRAGESSISGATDKMLLASAGPVALDGAEFALATGRGSAHELAIAQVLLAAGDEAKPPALLAKFGAITLGGIDFDWGKQHILVKSLRVGESSVSGAKDNMLLASAGPVALDGAEFALSTGRGSAQEITIAQVLLASGDEAKPHVRLRQIAFDGIAFELRAQRASAKGLRVAELALAAKRDANGELDLLRLFPGRGGEAGAKPAAWQASIGRLELGNGSARYTDATAKTPLALALDGLSGTFSFEAAAAGAGVRVRLDAGNFALAKLDALAASASPATAPQPAIRLANLSLNGARYDSGANVIEAGSVRLGRLGVDTVLENGRPSLLDLLPAVGQSKTGKPLLARAKAFELDEGSITVADRTNGIDLALGGLAGKLSDISTDSAQPLAFDLSADIKSGGRVALRGRAVPAQGTLEARIEASSVALVPVQAIVERFGRVKFVSGEVSLFGTLRAGGKDAKLAYSGSAGIANLALDDPAGVRLFGWKSLATESLKATLSPNRVDIDELRLTAPAGRFAIAKDGTSNISRAFVKNQAVAGESKPPAPEAGVARAAEPAAAPGAKADAPKPGDEGAFAVAVRRMRVDQGALDFSDDSLSPNFVAKIVDLAGTANGLSTNHDTRSQFALEGRVDEFGYARLSGAVNPFAPRSRSTFRVQMRNIDLVTATPYAMRFAGYRIASGRLGMDLNYRVRDSAIEGDNKITLEQFTLGERVDSPDALKLPFELAVKLLKDSDGVISMEVPVKGNLEDPQFSLAPLIWKAVGNLIGNIVAAPFRALAHLFGGSAGEDLGAIAFNPGRARLLPPEKEKLGRVVGALAKHPDLKLVIAVHYDSEADARSMKRTVLGRDIARRAGFKVADDEEPGPVNVEDRPTRRALRAIFAERFSKSELDRLRTEAEAKARAAGQAAPSIIARVRNIASGAPQVLDSREFHQTLLRRLRETQTLPANALADLVQQRALTIEATLKAAGVDASRISRAVAEPSADAEAKQVTARLTLAAK